MLQINIKNVEELIFFNKELKKQLLDFDDLFNRWSLGKRVASLKDYSSKAKLDLLGLLQDQHIKILENYFKTKVSIERINYHIVNNYEFKLDECETNLLSIDNISSNFCIARSKNKVYLSFWR